MVLQLIGQLLYGHLYFEAVWHTRDCHITLKVNGSSHFYIKWITSLLKAYLPKIFIPLYS